MIPKRVQEHFARKLQKRNGDNGLVEGMVVCCNSCDFEAFVAGEIKYGWFSKMYLVPEDDKVVLEVRCKKCGKVIRVFDNGCDGYDQLGTSQPTHVLTKPIACKKCQDNTLAVSIKYEYPDFEELERLGVSEMDNAFTWIWITLACNKCGAKYKNFIDYETA